MGGGSYAQHHHNAPGTVVSENPIWVSEGWRLTEDDHYYGNVRVFVDTSICMGECSTPFDKRITDTSQRSRIPIKSTREIEWIIFSSILHMHVFARVTRVRQSMRQSLYTRQYLLGRNSWRYPHPTPLHTSTHHHRERPQFPLVLILAKSVPPAHWMASR